MVITFIGFFITMTRGQRKLMLPKVRAAAKNPMMRSGLRPEPALPKKVRSTTQLSLVDQARRCKVLFDLV